MRRTGRLPRIRPRRRFEVLAEMAQRDGWARLAELGVLEGKTARYMLQTCPTLEWWGVDTWRYGDEDTPEPDKKTPRDEGARAYLSHPLGRYRDKVREMAQEFRPRATVMEMTTAEAAHLIPDGWLCAVFQDADHTEEGVAADIEAWLPKIRPGGMFLGHDSDIPAVRRAIDRLLPGWQHFDDSVWGIRV